MKMRKGISAVLAGVMALAALPVSAMSASNRGRRRLPKHVCRHLGCNAAHRVYVDAVDLLRGQRLAAVVGRKRLRERCQLPLIGFHWQR